MYTERFLDPKYLDEGLLRADLKIYMDHQKKDMIWMDTAALVYGNNLRFIEINMQFSRQNISIILVQPKYCRRVTFT